MIVKKDIDIRAPLTEEQIKELETAEKTPIVYDWDCPKLSKKQLSQFRRVSEINHEKRKKVTLTLRLPKSTVEKAKSLGKGYTSVLSRILEAALNDNEILEKYL